MQNGKFIPPWVYETFLIVYLLTVTPDITLYVGSMHIAVVWLTQSEKYITWFFVVYIKLEIINATFNKHHAPGTSTCVICIVKKEKNNTFILAVGYANVNERAGFQCFLFRCDLSEWFDSPWCSNSTFIICKNWFSSVYFVFTRMVEYYSPDVCDSSLVVC